ETHYTGHEAIVSVQGEELLTTGAVPNLLASGRSESCAVGAETNTHVTALEIESEDFLHVCAVPNYHSSIQTCRGKASAVWRETDRTDGEVVPLQSKKFLAVDAVPDFHGPIMVTGGQPRAVGIKAHALYILCMPCERAPFSAERAVPQLHRPVHTGRGKQSAIRAEANTQYVSVVSR